MISITNAKRGFLFPNIKLEDEQQKLKLSPYDNNLYTMYKSMYLNNDYKTFYQES